MSNGLTSTFHLPQGWTLRKVASSLAQEWLTPYRAAPAMKAARWVVQAVVDPDKVEEPLWEAGISTSEYEQRLNRPDLCWAIRATAGRGKATMLARLNTVMDKPDTFEIATYKAPFPETLFDAAKVEEFMAEQQIGAVEEFFPALLKSNGFREGE